MHPKTFLFSGSLNKNRWRGKQVTTEKGKVKDRLLEAACFKPGFEGGKISWHEEYSKYALDHNVRLKKRRRKKLGVFGHRPNNFFFRIRANPLHCPWITNKRSKVKWCKYKPAIYSTAPYFELATHSVLHQKYITEATKTTPPQLGNARIQVVVQYWLSHATWIHLSQHDCFHRTPPSFNTPD